jgi:hypothetical protein
MGDVEKALKVSCTQLAKDINAELKAMREAKNGVSISAGTPSEPSMSRSPSKSPTKPVLRNIVSTSSQTPSQKRKVAFAGADTCDADAMLVDETPTKKPRTSPSKVRDDPARNAYAAFQAAMRTPTRPSESLAAELEASSSKLTLDLLNSSQKVDGGDEDVPDRGEDDVETAEDLPVAPVNVESSSDINMNILQDDKDAEMSSEVVSEHEHISPRRSGRTPKLVVRDFPHSKPSAHTRGTDATTKGMPGRKQAKTKTHEKQQAVAEVPKKCRHRPVLASHKQWLYADAQTAREYAVREQQLREWAKVHGFGQLSDLVRMVQQAV